MDPDSKRRCARCPSWHPAGGVLVQGAATALSLSAPDDVTCGLLSGLTALDASGTLEEPIESLAGIQNAGNLTDLSLEDQAVTDISPLSGLVKLTELALGANLISDLSPLSGLTSLTTLYLFSNAISDLSPIGGLSSLSLLDVERNEITDLGAVSGLTSLTFLLADDNTVVDISPLTGLTSLSALSLGDNQISDIGPVSGLTGLIVLNLEGNSVTDVSLLSELTSLMILILEENEISDISGLEALTSLSELDLGANPLTDIQPLLDNPGIGVGDEIRLIQTMVSCGDIAALEARGPTVFSDCPSPPLPVVEIRSVMDPNSNPVALTNVSGLIFVEVAIEASPGAPNLQQLDLLLDGEVGASQDFGGGSVALGTQLVTLVIDTRLFPDGAHTLEARVTDGLDRVSLSDPIDFVIRNNP